MTNLVIPPDEWLAAQFEYIYCDECGDDERGHDAVPFMGNWFARCREDAVDRCGVTQDEPVEHRATVTLPPGVTAKVYDSHTVYAPSGWSTNPVEQAQQVRAMTDVS